MVSATGAGHRRRCVLGAPAGLGAPPNEACLTRLLLAV